MIGEGYMSSQCIVYVAISEDGFIADENGGVDWLPHPDDPEDTLGYQQLLSQIDTIAMGRKSYEQICAFGAWAWPEKKTIVFSHQEIDSIHSSITKNSCSPTEFMNQQTGSVWLMGGAELMHSFMKANLVDRYIITVVPNVKLGRGIPWKRPSLQPIQIKMDCAGGLVQYIYDAS
jgi:dihydrofolate reductase